MTARLSSRQIYPRQITEDRVCRRTGPLEGSLFLPLPRVGDMQKDFPNKMFQVADIETAQFSGVARSHSANFLCVFFLFQVK